MWVSRFGARASLSTSHLRTSPMTTNDYRIRSKATPQVEDGQRAGRISKVRNIPKCRIRTMATPQVEDGQRATSRANKLA